MRAALECLDPAAVTAVARRHLREPALPLRPSRAAAGAPAPPAAARASAARPGPAAARPRGREAAEVRRITGGAPGRPRPVPPTTEDRAPAATLRQRPPKLKPRWNPHASRRRYLASMQVPSWHGCRPAGAPPRGRAAASPFVVPPGEAARRPASDLAGPGHKDSSASAVRSRARQALVHRQGVWSRACPLPRRLYVCGPALSQVNVALTAYAAAQMSTA
jgi:hypothetical protein